MKHSPQIELRVALIERDRAEQLCPHWDYESHEFVDECCDRLHEAKTRVNQARKACNNVPR